MPSLLDGRKILIVEDEFLIAEDLAAMVRRMGGQVLGPAARIATALALLHGEPPDMALLDVNVAGDRVYRVAEALQEARIPFAFTTGYDVSAIDPRFRGWPCLEKPISELVLAEALTGMLGRIGAPGSPEA